AGRTRTAPDRRTDDRGRDLGEGHLGRRCRGCLLRRRHGPRGDDGPVAGRGRSGAGRGHGGRVPGGELGIVRATTRDRDHHHRPHHDTAHRVPHHRPHDQAPPTTAAATGDTGTPDGATGSIERSTAVRYVASSRV